MILLMIMSEIFSFKSILFIYIIITIIYLIYLLLDLYIFILYINKKITTPSYFPNYLRNWLIEKEERSQLEVEALRGFVDLHVRNILVYILSLLIIITIYILRILIQLNLSYLKLVGNKKKYYKKNQIIQLY